MTLEITIKGDIQKFTPDEHDVIVMRVDDILQAEQTSTIKETIKSIFPDNKVLVFDKRFNLEVYSTKEILELLNQEEKHE